MATPTDEDGMATPTETETADGVATPTETPDDGMATPTETATPTDETDVGTPVNETATIGADE
jgi:hypothetical protein